MAFVVVTAALHLARSHGQHRLAAVQRLDLRLLIHAEDHGSLGRIQVQTHDIADLLDQKGIGRQLEVRGPMRLQAEGSPQARDRRVGEAVADRRHGKELRATAQAWLVLAERIAQADAIEALKAKGK